MNRLTGRLRHNADREWEQDGLPQLVLGGATLIMLLGLLVPVLWRPGIERSWYITSPALIAWGVILLRYKQILLWLKSRLTFPRAGYSLPVFLGAEAADPRPGTAENYSITDVRATPAPELDRRQQVWNRVLSALIGVFAFLNLFIPGPLQPWFFPFWLLVVLLLIARTAYGRTPLTLFAAALASVLLYFVFRFPPKHHILMVTACFAAGLSIDGAVSLVLFLRRHPRTTA